LNKTGRVLFRFFSLPDYTVGSGFSPDQPFSSRALLHGYFRLASPPVRNWRTISLPSHQTLKITV